MDDYTDKFEEFWQGYPKRVGRIPAFKRWEQHNCEAIADSIIAHVRKRARHDPAWLGQKRMIPNPETFLNQKRWEDEYETVAEAVEAEEKRDAKRHSGGALDFEEVRRGVKMLILRNYADETILDTFRITPYELSQYRQRLQRAPSVLVNDYEREWFAERPRTQLVEVKI